MGVCSASAALVTFCALTAHAGKLDELRERTDHPSDDGSSNDDDKSDDDGCSWLQALFSSCPGQTQIQETEEVETTGGGGVPSAADVERQREALLMGHYFLPYPYAFGNRGNSLDLKLRPDLEASECSEPGYCSELSTVAVCIDSTCYARPADGYATAPEQRQLRSMQLQLFADLGRDHDGLVRGTLGGVVSTTMGLGLDTRWTYWVETQPNETDSLWLGDVNLRWEFLQTRFLQLALGAGPRALVDGAGSSWGANVTGALELYPVRPLVLRVEGDFGNLSRAVAYEGQASLGVELNRVELYAGASTLRIDGLNFDSLFAGVRAHL
ncbi:MAG TPA: hypothetical protein VHM70_11270 [Polyangiaceae bacterium]|jgi:hypothetical protein|nr:hypothetical protein [Polyangiaceae bacterium]